MSTKIYNAFKYNGTIDSLFKDIKKLKKKYWEFLSNPNTLDFEIGFLPLGLLEEFFIMNPSLNKNESIKIKELNFYALYDFLKLANRTTSYRITASCVIYPHKDKLYIEFFGFDCLDYFLKGTDIFLKLEDFHYQNQVDFDYDENITEEEWKEREIVWEEIFEDSPIPSASGLVYDFDSDLFQLCKYLTEKWEENKTK